MRDLEDPRLWVESYQTPTWVEYIRHNQRRTKADADSADRLRELHRGEDLPRVQRRIVRQAAAPTSRCRRRRSTIRDVPGAMVDSGSSVGSRHTEVVLEWRVDR